MSKNLMEIEKLKGSTNYHSWCFAILCVIDCKGYRKCIDGSETDADKLTSCRGLIALSVETSIYPHIENSKTAKEIWEKLKELYDNKGMSRKISILRSLVSIRLENCESIQNYVDKIVSDRNKLVSIGFDISNDWLTAILLAGLNEAYRPLVMTIEASEDVIKADNLIATLLEFNVLQTGNEGALLSKGKKFKKDRKCYNCHGLGHISKDCKKPRKDDKKNSNNSQHGKANNAFIAFLSRGNENDWYLDSGASSHMTPCDKILTNEKNAQVQKIIAANNAEMQVKKCGDATIKVSNNHIDIHDVLYVPQLAANLLSVSKIASKGNTVIFNSNGCTIRNPRDEIIAYASAENGAYKLCTNNETAYVTKAKITDLNEWNKNLGHLNIHTLKKC